MLEFDDPSHAIGNPAQAHELAGLLELQAIREGLWSSPPIFPDSPRERRQAREEYERTLNAAHEKLSQNLRGYSDRYCPAFLSQKPLNGPATLGAWCRLVVQVYQALGQDTAGVACEHIMNKAARSAKRFLPGEYVPVCPGGGRWSVPLAINSLQLLAQHCESMVDPASADGE